MHTIRILLLSLMLCASAEATITRVQSTSATTAATNAASITFTFGSNMTIGNMVVVVGTMSATAVPYFNTSNVSNGWYIVYPQNSNGTVTGFIMWAKVLLANTTVQITTLSGGNTAMCGVAVEYSGTSITQDTSAFNSGSSTTPATGSITTTQSNELLVGAISSRGTFSSNQTAWLTSPTNSFSSVLQTSTSLNTTNNDRDAAFLERIVSSTGTYSTGGTQTTNQWDANIVGFYEGTATGGPTSSVCGD